jgi:hypothetical protein
MHRRRGKFVYYAIADTRIVKVLEEVESILAGTGTAVDRCPRYEARPRAGDLASRSVRRPRRRRP